MALAAEGSGFCESGPDWDDAENVAWFLMLDSLSEYSSFLIFFLLRFFQLRIPQFMVALQVALEVRGDLILLLEKTVLAAGFFHLTIGSEELPDC